MCTAITFPSKDFYFGRNLDLERSYNETVTITPRNYIFTLCNGTVITEHLAFIGMATVVDGYPLYYEATNEKGLSIAGLNFPENAVYYAFDESKTNITPFELIPWLMAGCASVSEAKQRLNEINLWDMSFSVDYPSTPLHWILADSSKSITIESLADGLHVYDNPVGVLSNNPPFPFHIQYLTGFMNLTVKTPENRFSTNINIKPYSLGMGAMGLPGDVSSASRFVKAAFTKLNSVCGESEEESVSQFFHILGSVTQQRGITTLPNGEFEITRYSCCCNATRGIYYYTTYNNRQITSVDMHKTNLNNREVTTYPLITHQQIYHQN